MQKGEFLQLGGQTHGARARRSAEGGGSWVVVVGRSWDGRSGEGAWYLINSNYLMVLAGRFDGKLLVFG